MDTMVQEVTAVENAADVGIRWFSIGGWTSGATPDPRASVSILSDAAGALPETNPAIGYHHAQATVPGTKFATAIDRKIPRPEYKKTCLPIQLQTAGFILENKDADDAASLRGEH